MKLLNGDIFASRDALRNLASRDDIPLKYAMQIVRMAKKLQDEYVLIDEKRNRMIQKWGEEKDGQLSISKESPNWQKFVNDFNELMNLETEVNIDKVKIPENIVVKDLLLLEPFLEVVSE